MWILKLVHFWIPLNKSMKRKMNVGAKGWFRGKAFALMTELQPQNIHKGGGKNYLHRVVLSRYTRDTACTRLPSQIYEHIHIYTCFTQT